MRRWILLAAAFYPKPWREEYGPEFAALLEDVRPGWKVLANVLGGAVKMQMTNGRGWLKLSAAMAVAGALVAVAASFAVAPRYISSAVMVVMPQPDPMRPASQEAAKQRAADNLIAMQTNILSRSSLAEIITKPSLNLYAADRHQLPLEDVVQKMRRDIRIEPTAGGPGPLSFRISFAYPDQLKAQAVLRELVTKFTEANLNVNRNRAFLYRNFWEDQARTRRIPLLPPPPPGENLAVLDPPSLPKEAPGPNRFVFLGWGLLGGLLIGLAVVTLRLGGRTLALCAAAGLVIGLAVAFWLPDHYTSTAVMRVSPALITEDPLASPPAAAPVDEVIRRLTPTVLSRQRLEAIIRNPRINLYRAARARQPIAQAIDTMARDLRIEPLGGPAFSVSFTYTDRYKAQSVVREIITAFFEVNVQQAAEKARRASPVSFDIEAHRAGENLEVLDPATLPEVPVAPNRLAIAAAGLGAGALLGALILWIRRPRPYAGRPISRAAFPA